MIFVYKPGKARYPKNLKSWKRSQRNLYTVNSKVVNYQTFKALYLRFKFLRTQAKANLKRIQKNSREIARSMKGFSEVMTKNKEGEVAECGAVVELLWIKAVTQTPRGS